MENRLVQAQIRHQAFELAIFLPQLAQLAQLTHAEGAESFLPPVEALLADAELATDLPDRGAGLGLAQCQRDLFIRELARLHRGPPASLMGDAVRDRSLAQNGSPRGLRSGEERHPGND